MTDTTPLVSILMPVYQAERWLSEALESAFAQTFEDFELIAVDDGSTDGSAEILRDWSRREPRLRAIRAEHGGVTLARERTVHEARGRFAAFLDADDRWLPQRLERQLPYADDGTIVFSDAYIVGEDGPDLGTYSARVPPPRVDWPASGLFGHLLRVGSFIPMLTVLAPVRSLRDGGSFRRAERTGFGGPAKVCEDFEMWLALSLAGMRFHYIDEPLAIYRSRSKGLAADSMEICVQAMRIYDSFERDASGDELRQLRLARRRMSKYLSVAHRKEAWLHLLRRDRGGARLQLLASLRARPTAPRAWLALLLFHVGPVARHIAARGAASISGRGGV